MHESQVQGETADDTVVSGTFIWSRSRVHTFARPATLLRHAPGSHVYVYVFYAFYVFYVFYVYAHVAMLTTSPPGMHLKAH
jgi:hypothetical protein